MSDDMSPPHTGDRAFERGRRHGRSERSANRAVGAAIVAGGLAFSVSLYPLPSDSQILDGLPSPDHELTEFPALIKEAAVDNDISDASELQLTDLVKLAELFDDDILDVPPVILLELVKTYGLPDVVKSLEFIKSLAPTTEHFFDVAYSGGGASANAAPNALPGIVILLEYLMHYFPSVPGCGLLELITRILPTFMQSLVGPHPVAVPIRPAEIAAIVRTPLLTGLGAPVSPEAKFATFAEAPPPTPQSPIAPSAPKPYPAQFAASVEAPATTAAAASASTLSEVREAGIDPSESGVPKPKTSQSDVGSPQSGSSGGSNSVTSVGAAGDSSGSNSARGAAGGSSGSSARGAAGGSSGGSPRGSAGESGDGSAGAK